MWPCPAATGLERRQPGTLEQPGDIAEDSVERGAYAAYRDGDGDAQRAGDDAYSIAETPEHSRSNEAIRSRALQVMVLPCVMCHLLLNLNRP